MSRLMTPKTLSKTHRQTVTPLTERQRLFCQAYVSNGGNGSAAARSAGYSDPGVSACNMLKLTHVSSQIATLRRKFIACEGGTVALSTMRCLMEPDVDPRVRYQAARWFLEAAGHGIRTGDKTAELAGKPLQDMTLEELGAFIKAGREAMDAAAKQEMPAGSDGDAANDPAIDADAQVVDVQAITTGEQE